MAATKKTPPGIKKPAPRSSKVVPITPRELRELKALSDRADAEALEIINNPRPLYVPQTPDSLRQKLANWLESFARWVRA